MNNTALWYGHGSRQYHLIITLGWSNTPGTDKVRGSRHNRLVKTNGAETKVGRVAIVGVPLEMLPATMN